MNRVSEGISDDAYCEKLRQEAPVSARYLEEHGVKFVHHDEPNVLLEFKTQQHFVFPEGGGNAIIQNLLGHIRKYDNADILYQTEAYKLLTDDSGAIRGLKVRKNDGLLHDLLAPDVVLACGGFEGNQEMLARYIGRESHRLPLIAPGLKYNRGKGLQMCLEVGAGTAGSFDGMHCELVDKRANKPDAVIWGMWSSPVDRRTQLLNIHRTRLRNRRQQRVPALLRRRSAPPLCHIRNDRTGVLARPEHGLLLRHGRRDHATIQR